MPTIRESLDHAAVPARTCLEHAHQAGIAFPATVLPYRGRDLIAIAAVPEGDGRHAARLAGICAAGYRADLVVLVTDTWVAKSERGGLSPLTGKPWERGEMQLLVEQHDALAKGWITEALVVLAVNRAGDAASVHLAYRQDGDRINWTDPQEQVGNLNGLLVDSLRSAMAGPDLDQELLADLGVTPAGFGPTPDQAGAHSDVAMTRFLVERGLAYVSLVVSAGTERERIVRERLPDARTIGLAGD
jgi:hypothetical protein